jgi:DNA-binding transcriptional regulator YiaG
VAGKCFRERGIAAVMQSHYMRGEVVAEARIREFPEPDVKAIRERTGLSQTPFAYLIGVKGLSANKLNT